MRIKEIAVKGIYTAPDSVQLELSAATSILSVSPTVADDVESYEDGGNQTDLFE